MSLYVEKPAARKTMLTRGAQSLRTPSAEAEGAYPSG
jgi:hypothetical protein